MAIETIKKRRNQQAEMYSTIGLLVWAQITKSALSAKSFVEFSSCQVNSSTKTSGNQLAHPCFKQTSDIVSFVSEIVRDAAINSYDDVPVGKKGINKISYLPFSIPPQISYIPFFFSHIIIKKFTIKSLFDPTLLFQPMCISRGDLMTFEPFPLALFNESGMR